MTTAADLTATEALAQIGAGQLTSEHLVRACLDRISERDPLIEAWAYIDPGQAIAQARERDAAQARGGRLGRLHGIPVAIKDIIDTADMPTENGSAHFVGHRPERDATCVAALRAEGAVIMGKTVTTELATLTPGKTRNPHNPRHTPGGSSSGSAAAVASGMVPLALGTQTGGSVVRPASFCGIHALKPTLGLIPRTGVTLQSHTLDTVGVYGRSLDDIALVTDSLAVFDPSDDVSFPRAVLDLVSAVSKDRAAPKLAFYRTPAWGEAEHAAQAAIEALCGRISPAPATLELPPDFNEIITFHKCVQFAENAHHFGHLMETAPSRFTEGLRERLDYGATISAKAYLGAVRAREQLYGMLLDAMRSTDALICLSSPGPAPATLETTGNPVFNGLWTYLGVPTVSLPLLEIDDLPCGVTMVGPRRGEAGLLSAARWFEAAASRA